MRKLVASLAIATACLAGLLVLRAADQAAPAAHGLDEALRAIDARVTADFAQDGVGGLSIGVVSGNRLVWSKHFGYAESETKRVADNDTDYRIGSITKQFTAVALLQLVEQKKMQLSDPLEKYVPEIQQVKGLPAGSPPITVLQVATMHSGLSREPGCENHSVGPVSGWQQRVISCLPSTTYANPPGTTYLYSNIGYASLGLAIERAGAQPYVDQVTKRIFEPLRMSRSAMEPTAEIRRNLAHGYQRNGGGTVSREAADHELDGRGYRVPNGAIFSTMNDLAKFVSWELGASSTTLISKSMQTSNYAQTFPADSPAAAYGVGFQQIKRGDVTMLGHGGSTAGYLSSALFHRASGYGVIVFRNCDSCETKPGPVAALALETIVKATATTEPIKIR